MLEGIDRELAEIMHEVGRKTPYTNAAAAHVANDNPLPGNVGGDCGAICKALVEATGHIPGEARLHSILPKEPGAERKGKPGSHVLVHKDIPGSPRIMDPYLLMRWAFDLGKGCEDIPTYLPGTDGLPTTVQFQTCNDRLVVTCNELASGFVSPRPWSLFIAPADRVLVSGCENADAVYSLYVIRFLFADTVGQIGYNVQERELRWTEPTQGGSRVVKLNGLKEGTLRREVDERLREFDLDITTVSRFLREAYELSVAGQFV